MTSDHSYAGPGQARRAMDEIEAAVAASWGRARLDPAVPDGSAPGDWLPHVTGAEEPPD